MHNKYIGLFIFFIILAFAVGFFWGVAEGTSYAFEYGSEILQDYSNINITINPDIVEVLRQCVG